MEATQERLLRTLVDRALASAAAPHQPPAGSVQRPAQNARKGGGRAAADKQAEIAAAPKPLAASQAAVDVLLDLAEEPSCSRAALKLVLERAGTPGREVWCSPPAPEQNSSSPLAGSRGCFPIASNMLVGADKLHMPCLTTVTV